MKIPRMQFSLRGLLMVATLLAIAITFIANYPLITAVFLLFVGPVLLRVAATPYLAGQAPRRALWTMAFLQTAYSFGCVFCVLRAIPPARPDWRVYLWLGLFSGVAILCICLAWFQLPTSNASNHSNDL